MAWYLCSMTATKKPYQDGERPEKIKIVFLISLFSVINISTCVLLKLYFLGNGL